jgi:hypothetical protein
VRDAGTNIEKELKYLDKNQDFLLTEPDINTILRKSNVSLTDVERREWELEMNKYMNRQRLIDYR